MPKDLLPDVPNFSGLTKPGNLPLTIKMPDPISPVTTNQSMSKIDDADSAVAAAKGQHSPLPAPNIPALDAKLGQLPVSGVLSEVGIPLPGLPTGMGDANNISSHEMDPQVMELMPKMPLMPNMPTMATMKTMPTMGGMPDMGGQTITVTEPSSSKRRGIPGMTVLLPNASNGGATTAALASQQFQANGRHLGMFATKEAAEAYDIAMHGGGNWALATPSGAS